MGTERAVFLDLNGTLVLPVTPNLLTDYSAISSAFEAVAVLTRAGFVSPVVTVQSRIEKGFFTEDEFRGWFRSFSEAAADAGGLLKGPYVCPHRYSTKCACKKPDGALYRLAASELDIDIGSSFVVGDSPEDMAAAKAIGCKGVMVRTGWPVDDAIEREDVVVVDDVLAAARWIAVHRRE